VRRIQTSQLHEFIKEQTGAAAAQNPMPAISPADVQPAEGVTSVINLDVLQVRPFRNPRTEPNPKKLDIKESIRAAGLQQKIHVCKHPALGYVTARGGCTRLESLQELASETDDKGQPTKDAIRHRRVDFILVPYVTDTDLRVSHLSENLQRADMSFWDTAVGVFAVRTDLETEQGRVLSLRELEKLLSRLGLPVSYNAIIDYTFGLTQMSHLAEHLRHQVTRNDIRTTLRPGFTQLEKFWGKHSQRGPTEFEPLYQESIALYAPDRKEFSAVKLAATARDYIGLQLGYEPEQFSALLQAFALDDKAPLEELLIPVGTGTPSENVAPAHEPLGEVSSDGKSTTGVSAAAVASTPAEPAGELAGLAGAPSMLLPTTPAGLQVASGLRSKQDVLHDVQGDLSAAQLQDAFAGMSPTEIAAQHVLAQLQEVGEIVGLGDLLRIEPNMPSGYFVEMPEPGHLGSTDDLAAQGWWLLACLSGQIAHAAEQLPAGSIARAAVADVASWRTAVETRLGGGALDGADFITWVLTHPSHALAQPALALIQAVRDLNVAREADSGDAQS